jgi:hypothetical protein
MKVDKYLLFFGLFIFGTTLRTPMIDSSIDPTGIKLLSNLLSAGFLILGILLILASLKNEAKA